jgi:hypothetical protein
LSVPNLVGTPIGYQLAQGNAFNYMTAPGNAVIVNGVESFLNSLFADTTAEFTLAAEGPVTVGDILAGHSSDTMIHLTTATEDELATATFPNFTPPHTTPGVFQGSSWVQLGDVSHMTLPEYQELVVGPSAAG